MATCTVCLEDLEGHKVILGCHHSFHLHCWVKLEEHCIKSFVLCPLCRHECPRISPFKGHHTEEDPEFSRVMARFTVVGRCVQYVLDAANSRDRFVRADAAMIVLTSMLPRLGMLQRSVDLFINIVMTELFAPLLAGDLMFERQMRVAVTESFNVPVPRVDGFEQDFATAMRRRTRAQKRKRKETERKSIYNKVNALKGSMRRMAALDPSLGPYLREEMSRLDVLRERVSKMDSSSSDD